MGRQKIAIKRIKDERIRQVKYTTTLIILKANCVKLKLKLSLKLNKAKNNLR